MIATKLSTFILGCVFLSPFLWTFGQMIFHDAAVAERTARGQMDAILTEQGLEEMKDGKNSNGEIPMNLSAMAVDSAVLIHPSLYAVWSASPRRWVGWVGMTCCLVILGLWAFSSFSRVRFYSPMLTTKEEPHPHEVKVISGDNTSWFQMPLNPPDSGDSK